VIIRVSVTTEKALNFIAGMATNVSASAFFAANPVLGGLCLGLAAMCVATDGVIESGEQAKAEAKVADTLRRLLQQNGTLARALAGLGAEQDMHELVSRQRTAKLLRAIRKHARQSQSLLAGNLQLTGQIGIWLQRWCEEQKLSDEELSEKIDDAAIQLNIKFGRIELKVDKADARSAEADAATHDYLRTILDRLPSAEDLDSEIDAAKERLRIGKFDEALALLERLRKRAWDRLSDRQKFRVLANTGHAQEGKDNYLAAAELFLEAARFQPDDAHAQCLACVALAHRNDPSAAKAAEELRAKQSQNALAQAIWLKLQPDTKTLDELMEAVPEPLRKDAEVAIALSHVAVKQSRPDEAENYARLAAAVAPDNPRVKMHLGLTLVDCERRRVTLVDGARPLIQDNRKLQEAISLLSVAIDALGPSAGAKTVSSARRARGLAYDLLGQDDKAELDFQVAYDRTPQDPVSSLDYALVQAERGAGGIDRAIDALAQVPQPERIEYANLQLARLLAKRNRPGDLSQAIDVLRTSIASADGWSEYLRIASIGLLAELLGDAGDHDGARLAIRDLPAEFLPAPVMAAAGQPDAAVAAARNALSLLCEESTEAQKRRVSQTLLAVKLFAEALPLLTSIVKPTFVGRDTLRLLEAARACGDDATILTFCRSLRENGHFDPFCIDIETATLGRYHGFSEAIGLLNEYLTREQSDAEI
jgi:hypothetical protein